MILFDRNIELIFSNGYEIKTSDGAIIQYNYKTNDGNGFPTCEVSIKNLDEDSRNSIDDKLQVFLNIGFGEDIGELTGGDINNIESDNTSIKFNITSSSKKMTKNFSKWYNNNVEETFVINDIAKNLNLNIQGINYLSGFRRTKGLTVHGSAIKTISKICRKRGLNITSQGSTLIIYNKKDTKKLGNILLKNDSGLIDVNVYKSEDKKYDFVIKSLPINEIKQGDLIKVEHYKLNAKCKVIDFDIDGSTNWVANYYIKVVK